MSQRGLCKVFACYSAACTLAVVILVLAAARSPKTARFDEITVGRIKVVEPDGTPRLVISNGAASVSAFDQGKEVSRPDRPGAGIIFIDDRGSEIGGLLWGGKKDANGKASGYGHLSFDRFDGDQLFTAEANTDGKRHSSTLRFDEEGDYSLPAIAAEGDRIQALPEPQRSAEWKKYLESYPRKNRIVLGKMMDRSSELRMRDTEGRDRVVIRVAPDGNPSIELLDEKGKTISRLPK